MAANCCQRMCHFGLSLPISLKPVGGITSHLGHKLILGSSIVSQTLTLGWPRLTLNFFGGGLQQEDHFELKTLGETVGSCQSLPSVVVLLEASYSIYYLLMSASPPRYSRWRQIHLKSQMFHSNLPPLRLLQ